MRTHTETYYDYEELVSFGFFVGREYHMVKGGNAWCAIVKASETNFVSRISNHVSPNGWFTRIALEPLLRMHISVADTLHVHEHLQEYNEELLNNNGIMQ